LLILSARSERFKVQQWERARNDWSDTERKYERSNSDRTAKGESNNQHGHLDDGANAAAAVAAGVGNRGRQSG
jgi:hypothetical protein